MKATVVLLADRVTLAELHSRLQGLGRYTEREFFDTLCVGECELGLDASGDVLDEYEESEIAELTSKFGDLAALLVEYTSSRCLRTALSATTAGLRGLVDDNFGKLWEFRDFVADVTS